MLVAFFLAVLMIVGPIALDVAPGTNLQAGARQRASRNAADPNRVLLDSLGAYPGATQIRAVGVR